MHVNSCGVILERSLLAPERSSIVHGGLLAVHINGGIARLSIRDDLNIAIGLLHDGSFKSRLNVSGFDNGLDNRLVNRVIDDGLDDNGLFRLVHVDIMFLLFIGEGGLRPTVLTSLINASVEGSKVLTDQESVGLIITVNHVAVGRATGLVGVASLSDALFEGGEVFLSEHIGGSTHASFGSLSGGADRLNLGLNGAPSRLNVTDANIVEAALEVV